MQSAQEIFQGRFRDHAYAVVQRCDDNEDNRLNRISGRTQHWPRIQEKYLGDGQTVIVLSVKKSDTLRTLYAGELRFIRSTDKNKYCFVVDTFDEIGEHDLSAVSDRDFYVNGGGGGSRVIVPNRRRRRPDKASDKAKKVLGAVAGLDVQRELWVRKNHHRFRDPVYDYWDEKCAVFGVDCNNLLVASHIKPWSKSSSLEKTDRNNGLLLSVGLDKLFDLGFISFGPNGKILIWDNISTDTANVFSLRASLCLPKRKITQKMADYLKWHRENVFRGAKRKA